MINEKFVILGAFISFLGAIRYILDTLEGKTKPNRVTWILWALAPLIAFAAEIHEGVGLQSLLTFMGGFTPLLILIASFVNKKSEWKLTRFDYTCGILSILGVILWAITRQGNLAIAFSLIADILASTPTVVKAYKQPETETAIAYSTVCISAAITLLTIKNWTFANYAFPIYFFSVCLLIFSLVQFKLGRRISELKAT